MRRVVVLPHPDGPSSEKNSPPAISRSMPRTAGTSSYALVNPTREMAPPLTRSVQHSRGEAREVGHDPVGVGRGVLDGEQPLLDLAPRRQEPPAVVLHEPV